MNRAIRCTGYALAGIAIASGGLCVVIGCAVILVWAGDASARFFDLPEKCGLLFFMAYIAATLGAIIGAAHCPSEAVSRPQPNGATK